MTQPTMLWSFEKGRYQSCPIWISKFTIKLFDSGIRMIFGIDAFLFSDKPGLGLGWVGCVGTKTSRELETPFHFLHCVFSFSLPPLIFLRLTAVWTRASYIHLGGRRMSNASALLTFPCRDSFFVYLSFTHKAVTLSSW